MSATFLSDLLSSTRTRVEEAKSLVSEDVLEARIAAAPPPRGFKASLGGPDTAVVAEIKRATPSKGSLTDSLDAGRLAAAYAAGGAAAISVLTEPDRFKGLLEDLQAAQGPGLPVLRKDFVIDPFQVLEGRAAGADAILLIARIVPDTLGELVRLTEALGMDALVEVFDEDDARRAERAGASLVGINHRDLETFEVDGARTRKLAPSFEDSVTLVSLSGVSTRSEVESLAADGAAAVLVGEALVTSADPALKLRELRGV
jgi:indole-3-glycerol phosphate synthase